MSKRTFFIIKAQIKDYPPTRSNKTKIGTTEMYFAGNANKNGNPLFTSDRRQAALFLNESDANLMRLGACEANGSIEEISL